MQFEFRCFCSASLWLFRKSEAEWADGNKRKEIEISKFTLLSNAGGLLLKIKNIDTDYQLAALGKTEKITFVGQ